MDAIVFVYDMSDLKTFTNLSVWLSECRSQMPYMNPPRFLVANKADRMPDIKKDPDIPPFKSDSARPGRRFAVQNQMQGFFALSARHTKDESVFEGLTERVARAAVISKRFERGESDSASSTVSSVGSWSSAKTPVDEVPAFYGRHLRIRSSLTNRIRFDTTNSLKSSTNSEKTDGKCC